MKIGVPKGYNEINIQRNKKNEKTTYSQVFLQTPAKPNVLFRNNSKIDSEISIKDIVASMNSESVKVKQDAQQDYFQNIPISINWEGIDRSNPLNMASTGDHILTDDETAYLTSKYDINNLSKQGKYDLLVELTEMNVLTVDDVMSIGLGVIPRATLPLLIEIDSVGPQAKNFWEDMISALSKMVELEKPLDDIFMESINEEYRQTYGLYNAHKKLLSIMSSLDRNLTAN